MRVNAARRSRISILYDDDCGFCKVCVALLLHWDRSQHLYPVAIQDQSGQLLLASIPKTERLRFAHLVTARGAVLSGADAGPVLFRELPGGIPLARLLAGSKPLTRLAYGFLTKLRPLIGSMLPAAWCARAARLIAERRRGTIPPTTVR